MVDPMPTLADSRIFVTNDDGIRAEGLEILERIARSFTEDVWVVAPETEQSGASHSLSLHRPLRLRQLGERRFAVDGTPTDCVFLGLNKAVMDRRPDLVLSGVNFGSNVGEDVTYSGTIAAAMEATLLNVPAIAMSQAILPDGRVAHWETAEKWGVEAVERCIRLSWPAHVLMNVNFPAVPPDQVKGLIAAPQALMHVGNAVEERIDPRGRPYFWIGMTRQPDRVVAPDSDIAVLAQGRVSITPLHLDLTHPTTLTRLEEALH